MAATTSATMTQTEICVLLDSLVESKADWLRRRVIEICEERISADKPINVKILKKSVFNW